MLEALHRLAQIPETVPSIPVPIHGFEEGKQLLEEHNRSIAGPPPAKRTTRIMVVDDQCSRNRSRDD